MSQVSGAYRFTALKYASILLTLLQIGLIALDFTNILPVSHWTGNLWIVLSLLAFHLLTQITFIYNIWTSSVRTKKSKWNQTWMIILLGIIGMWLYINDRNKAH